ncbi:MAG: alkaline phosphatase D family protein [Polyangiales bacterium]
MIGTRGALLSTALLVGCATETGTVLGPDDASLDASQGDVVDVSMRDVVDVSMRDVVDATAGELDRPVVPSPDVPAPRDVVTAPDVVVDVDPPPPTFPSRIGHLSFAVRTGSGTNDETDANALSLCLSETRCFRMNVADVNDFRRGEVDVYHFDDIDLPRSEVDRVEIRSVNGTDAWRMRCLEMQWDGEPVHCADGPAARFGDASGELTRWRDPAGVHRGCTSCYPDVVTHGPVVGQVTPSSARVMLRTDATRRVALRVLDDARPGEPPRRVVADPLPGDDFTARLDVTGLEAGRAYTALVEVDGRLSAARARFQTAPADGAAGTLRLALGSCARLDDQPIFTVIAAQRPDLFVWLGDNHYGNTGDLESLWWFYRRALEVPERASLLHEVPAIALWDDHDFVGNNTDRTSPGRAQALRAFQDYQPNLTYGQPASPGVYTRARWGDVDVFMLDVRYDRDPPGTPNGRIVSDAQMSWLEGELMRSTATFRLIASGTTFSAGAGESWSQYPASRDRLFNFIRANRIGGVALLSGDIHRSQLRRIHRTGSYDLPEIVSSPLANSTSNCPSSAEPDAAQVACFNATPSFVLLDIDTRASDPRMVARILDASGVERGRMEVLRSSLR